MSTPSRVRVAREDRHRAERRGGRDDERDAGEADRSGSGIQAGRACPGVTVTRRAVVAPTSAGTPCRPRRRSRCRDRRSGRGSTGPPRRSRDARRAVGSRTPSSVSRIAFGWPGRLRISAPPADDADLPRQDRRRHEVQRHLPHLLAEARHHAVRDGERRLRRHVARRGPGAAGRQHEVAADDVDELDQRALDDRLLVGNQPLLPRHGEASAVASHASSPAVPGRRRRRATPGRRSRRGRSTACRHARIGALRRAASHGAAAHGTVRGTCAAARRVRVRPARRRERGDRRASAAGCAATNASSARVVAEQAVAPALECGEMRLLRVAAPVSQRSSVARIGSGSTSRMSRPTNCSCRRRASCLVIAVCERAPRRRRRSGRSELGQPPASSATSVSPSACSASISCLRRVFDGSAACRRRRGREVVRAGGRRGAGVVGSGGFAMIDDGFQPAPVARGARAGATCLSRVRRGPCFAMTPPPPSPSAPRAASRVRESLPGRDGRAGPRGRASCSTLPQGRRHRGRDRGVAGGRAERHRAQGRRRDDCLQPRQGHLGHRLPRPAPRPREQRRLRRRSIRATVDKALAIARFTAEDPCAGLADADRLARGWPDLDLYHPVGPVGRRGDRDGPRHRSGRARASTAGSPIPKARRCRAANAISSTPTRWASAAATASSRHSHRCRRDRRGRRRHAARLLVHGRARARTTWSAPSVGRIAGERTARRLGARRARHARMPGAVRGARGGRPDRRFVHAISGGSLYRRARSCIDSLGTEVFAPQVSIREEPHLRAREAARPSTPRASRPRRATSSTRRRARLLPRQLRCAQARHDARPATPAAATTSSSRTATTTLPR